jgi:hypothetical protein
MKLSRKGLFVRWAYLGESDWNIPDRATVCSLFARAFLLSPLAGALFVLISPFLILTWLADKFNLHQEVPMPGVVRVVGQRFSDWKDRVCSVVEIE